MTIPAISGLIALFKQGFRIKDQYRKQHSSYLLETIMVSTTKQIKIGSSLVLVTHFSKDNLIFLIILPTIKLLVLINI
jgi:hypothetical protein